MPGVTVECVGELASLVGLTVPEEDAPLLAEALAAQVELIAPLLAGDFDQDAPAVAFDPRWPDDPA